MKRFWNKYRNYIIAAVIVVALFNLNTIKTAMFGEPPPEPSINELLSIIETNDIKQAEVTSSSSGAAFIFTLTNETKKTFTIPSIYTRDIVDALLAKKIETSVAHSSFSIGEYIIPVLFIGSILFSTWRTGGMAGLKSSFKPEKPDVKFKDVAGIDDVRDELAQIVTFLQNPKAMSELGGKSPRGTLLVGPPGTGKTMLARAVAGEAKVPFFAVSGSQFDEMYVGVGASRIRSIFKEAEKNAPCIIFIDEIDAIGKERKASDDKHSNQSLTELLTKMDGFRGDLGIIVLAATNRVADLDPALRRAGRFDREIQVPLPDIKGREAILKVTVEKRNVPLHKDVNLELIARGTSGSPGASLANLVNEAVLFATNAKHKSVAMDDFERAREKITMGLPRAHLLSERERHITAVHEAGHALVALKHTGVVDPIYKATIVPRGRALGMVVMLPETDSVMVSRKRLLAQLEVLFGGRMAELTLLESDDITTGASQDLQQITSLANRMVTEWGMGAQPNRAYRYAGDPVNNQMGKSMEYSLKLQTEIDDDINNIVNTAAESVKNFLAINKDLLTSLSERLKEKDTLTGQEIRDEFLPQLKETPVAKVA